MSYEAIEVEYPCSGIAILTLNRPERRNALAIAMMRSLHRAIGDLETDDSTRVVIVRGAGPVFCAGLDLSEASDRALVRESAECVARTLHCLRYSTLVTIAAVNGGAYAGGAGVVAACDMAVGATDIQIGFPEARRGLLPALISDVLRTKIREGDLAELFLVGAPIGAVRAQQIGLLQRIVEPARVVDEALEMGRGILAGGPQTIRDTKTLLHHAYGQTHGETHSIEEHLKARFSEEATEGLQAFLDKRPPNWLPQEK
ncbi:MAG: enoyl-CoA hydratase-related protein [Pirellula sp.]|jgi:methylglutaconyl-CoA hydratase|nr:enoyl-CoA hydratase-related protein [Pirellula sp.]